MSTDWTLCRQPGCEHRLRDHLIAGLAAFCPFCDCSIAALPLWQPCDQCGCGEQAHGYSWEWSWCRSCKCLRESVADESVVELDCIGCGHKLGQHEFLADWRTLACADTDCTCQGVATA